VLLGDGALLMCTNELATLARYAIPALVIVLDNGGYGTERPILDGPFNNLQPVAHRGLALAMGFSAAERVENEEELWSCLGRWRSDGMTVPHVDQRGHPRRRDVSGAEATLNGSGAEAGKQLTAAELRAPRQHRLPLRLALNKGLSDLEA